MGTFDTFHDPRFAHAFQSKAFGKGMGHFHPGDAVQAQRMLITSRMHRTRLLREVHHGDLQALAIPDVDDAPAHERYFIDVIGGVFTGISRERRPEVRLVDHDDHVIRLENER